MIETMRKRIALITIIMIIPVLLSAVPSLPYSIDTVISYHCLSDYQKNIVDTIYESLSDCDFMVEFDEAVPEAELDIAIENIMFDYPELFYIDYEYELYYTDDDTMITDISFNPTMSTDEIRVYSMLLFRKAEDILSMIPVNISDYEKELWLHDYLAILVDYSTETETDYTPQGALLRNTAACEGYAEAFTLLMRLAGIPCSTVSGTSFGEAHEWNIVKIGDEYAHVDITWDDMTDYISHQYFNIPDSILVKDHEKSAYYESLPDADTMEWNWHYRNGMIIGSDDDMTEAGMALIKRSAMTSSPAEYRFEDSEAYRGFETEIDSVLQKFADIYGDITYWKVPDGTEQTYCVYAVFS